MEEAVQPEDGQAAPRKNLLRSRYKTNAKVEEEGRWMTPAMLMGMPDASQFKIAAMSARNKKVLREEEKITQEQRIAIGRGIVPQEERAKIGLDKFVNACLIDWKNVFDDAGNVVAFSKAAARAILNELPELLEELIIYAQSAANYNEELLATDIKN